MKQTQHLKLRIERDGKIFHRYLRQKDSLTVGRSPDNDIVLYSDDYPMKARMFVPTREGYELRLIGAYRGEVLCDKSRLAFGDLVTHGLLPTREGFPVVPLTAGKAGYIFLDGVRIDFVFDGAKIEALEFEGFSATRSFLKSLTDDLLFRGIATALLVIHSGLLYWARGLELPPPKQDVAVSQIVQRITRFIPKVVEQPEAKIGRTAAEAASGESRQDDSEEKKQASSKAREGEKKGYGEGEGGQGVNLEQVGVLSLLGGTGVSSQSSNLIDALVRNDLARGLDEIGRATSLSAGRGKPGTGTDVNALLAAGIIGEGKGGGGASIDDILKGAIGAEQSINLEKKGRVNIDRLGAVSGSKEALGARSEESLRKVLTDNMGRLQYIYNKYLKTNPEIGGKVEVEVTINADGSVGKVTILKSEITLAAFEADIKDAVRRWHYEPIASGIMRVVYPILFVRMG